MHGCFEYILDCILHADCCRRGSKISCELILSWSPFWPTSSIPRAEYLKRASFGMSVAQMFQMRICYHRLPALQQCRPDSNLSAFRSLPCTDKLHVVVGCKQACRGLWRNKAGGVRRKAVRSRSSGMTVVILSVSISQGHSP